VGIDKAYMLCLKKNISVIFVFDNIRPRRMHEMQTIALMNPDVLSLSVVWLRCAKTGRTNLSSAT